MLVLFLKDLITSLVDEKYPVYSLFNLPRANNVFKDVQEWQYTIILYKCTFARRMNYVEIDREGRDLYLLRKWFSATTSAKSEISSVIRGRLNYTVKGAVDLNHLHGDIFFDGTVSRPPANLCSRILAANLIRATIRIDECCWT